MVHELEIKGPKLAGHQNLTCIKGIGTRSATILLSVIGDVNDFESEGKPARYFGLVPRVSNSNEQQHHGRITKRGSKLSAHDARAIYPGAIRYSPYLRQD